METAVWILVGMAIVAWLVMAGLMAYLWTWTLRRRWLRRTRPESADSEAGSSLLERKREIKGQQ